MTISYDESTEEHMFGIPADRRPRYVTYRAALDNYEPVPRNTEHGRLVEYDDELETSGQPRYMRATGRSDIPAGSVFIIDDGLTARPYYGGGHNAGKPSPLYPDGCEPYEILCPFPVNPDGKTRPDNGRVIDFSGWLLGPRKAYLLKVTPDPGVRRPVPHGEYMRIPHAVTCRKCKLTIEQVGGVDGVWVVADSGTTADGLSYCPPDPDARKVPGSHQPSPVTTRRTLHEHRYSGQRLVHDHPGGDLPHGYYQHPEDPL